MVNVTYNQQRTALLVIDPYNDVIAEGGKVGDRLQAVATANRCVPHRVQVLHAARQAWLRVFSALPRRHCPGDYKTWKSIAPVQEAAWSHTTFAHGTWGGESRCACAPHPGDIVALKHGGSSGFAHTDLDVQRKQHGIYQLIVMGLIAHVSDHGGCRVSKVALALLRCSPGRSGVLEMRTRHEETGAGERPACFRPSSCWTRSPC